MRESIRLKSSLEVVIGLSVLTGLYLLSLYNYLLFHCLVELFSIAVACGIFMFAWNSRRFMANDYLLFLGVAYLFVAILDLVHTLAYKGMNIFPGYGADLPTQLWIAARYTESLSFLMAALFFSRRVRPRVVLGGYSLAIGLLLAAIFGGIFPGCYVEGQGLTLFKKVSEYVISALLLISIYLVYRHRDGFHARVYWRLMWALALTVCSELAFTFYVSVYGLSNLIGHFFKLVSFYLIYEAIVATGLREPYELLFKQLEDSRQNLERRVLDRTIELDRRGRQLSKRVRELACLYAISDSLQQEDVAEEQSYQRVVELIPTGWRVPENTWARLQLNNQEFTTSNWTESGFQQEAAVLVHGRQVGAVEVRVEDPAGGVGPNLLPEQNLLDAAAALLGRFIAGRRDREELRRSREFTRTVLDSLNEGVSIIEPDEFFIVDANACFLAQAGLSRDQVIGRRCHELSHHLSEPCSGPDDDCPVKQTLDSGQAVSVEHVHRLPDDRETNVEITTSPMTDGDGRVVRVVHVCRDVTDRHRLEVQFRQAQKMEAVGRLAGGVAHDFNNLLTIITGYSEMALEDLSPGEPLFEELTEISQAGRRATDLTRQLMAFSRKQVLEPMPLDLGAILSGLEKMLTRTIGEDIELVVSLEPERGTVMADPGQIEQVIMNLAINARDAMPAGGKLTLEVCSVVLDEAYCRDHPEAVAGPHVMLAVTDTGIGMDKATRHRIFEPFFTTKEKGRGTGLGLATVYGVVKQSGGNIFVYSEPDKGTTFKLYFPRLDKAAARVEPGPTEQVRGGTESILVIEDDDGVRALIHRVLEGQGYQVTAATQGEEALRLARGREIDLVLTDVVMPGLSGPEVVRHLTAEHPRMRVLFTSGYTDNAVARHGILEPGDNLITKPLSREALIRKVRQILDADQKHRDSHENGRPRS